MICSGLPLLSALLRQNWGLPPRPQQSDSGSGAKTSGEKLVLKRVSLDPDDARGAGAEAAASQCCAGQIQFLASTRRRGHLRPTDCTAAAGCRPGSRWRTASPVLFPGARAQAALSMHLRAFAQVLPGNFGQAPAEEQTKPLSGLFHFPSLLVLSHVGGDPRGRYAFQARGPGCLR